MKAWCGAAAAALVLCLPWHPRPAAPSPSCHQALQVIAASDTPAHQGAAAYPALRSDAQLAAASLAGGC